MDRLFSKSLPYLAYPVKISVLALIYIAAVKLSLGLALVNGLVPLVWLPAGVALGALLLFGEQLWPGVILGALVGALTVDAPLSFVIVTAIGSLLEALAGVYFLRRLAHFADSLVCLRDVGTLLLYGAMLSSMINATISVTGLVLSGLAAWSMYRFIWVLWWLGDVMGVLLVTPLLLVWIRPFLKWTTRQAVEAGILFLLLFAVSEVVYSSQLSSLMMFPFVYTLFPFLIWAALRLGLRGAATAVFVSAGMMLWHTAQGNTLFAQGLFFPNLVYLYSFIGTMGMTTLLMAAVIAERDQSVITLHKSEERYRTIVQQAVEGIAVSDSVGNFTEVNPAFCHMLDYSEAELLQLNLREIITAENLPMLPLRLDELRAGKKLRVERYLQRRDGTTFLAEISVRMVLGGSLQAVVQDITERKRIEEALRESEARYRALVEGSGVGIWQVTLDRNTIYANPAMGTLLGLENAAELLDKPYGKFFTEESLDIIESQVTRYFSNITSSYEVELVCRNGEKRHAIVHESPVFAADGQLHSLIGTFVDITDRKHAIEDLVAEKNFVSSAIDSLPGIFYVFDEAGRFLRWNKNFETVSQYTAAEMASLHPLDLFSGQDKQLIAVRIAQSFAEGSATAEARFMTKDGQKTPYFFTGERVILDGKLCLVGMGIDITERQQAEELLRRTQKMESLGIMAGGIAHDFNNLLVAMLGQASLALLKSPVDNPVHRHVEQVVKAAERAAALTRQLLAYAGRSQVDMQPVQFNTLIEENLHLFTVAIPRHVQLITNLMESLPLIEGDVSQLQQVLMNLILNGAQAIIGKSGVVAVETNVCEVGNGYNFPPLFIGEPLTPGQYVTLIVRDNGSGIDAEIISRIFDPFFTTKETGHGLGLAAVLGIIQGHKGDIQIKSQTGQGTTFTLFFPVWEGALLV